DGSTDKTAEVVESFSNRVRFIQIEHSGLSAARNAGVLESTADFLLFLDSDDYLLTDTIERYLRKAVIAPSNTIFHGGWQTVDEDKNILSKNPPRHLTLDSFHSLLSGLIPPCNCLLVRRSFLQTLGMFDTSLSSNEDWDLWLRFAAAGVHFVPVPE